MTTSPRFENAKTALYNAFFNGTLAKGSCNACAVGNLIAYGQGGKVTLENHMTTPGCSTLNAYWANVFCSMRVGQVRNFGVYPELEERMLRETGYTAMELSQIEATFERNTKYSFEMYKILNEDQRLEDQYNGLCAVFDLLMELDGIGDDPIKERLKEKLTINPTY